MVLVVVSRTKRIEVRGVNMHAPEECPPRRGGGGEGGRGEALMESDDRRFIEY